jgi:hypothetical protein
MTSNCKKPGLAFWATVVVVVVLVGYPLSYGPYLAVSPRYPERAENRAAAIVYGPLERCIIDGPRQFAEPYIGYLECWSDSATWFRYMRRHPDP